MPQYPKNRLAQSIIQNCIAHHIENVVISPGSRNAPLTIGFVNHPKINAMSLVDERCAAFFALGIAQNTGKPTAIVCTSGSALLNYYPAVAEAYYSNIPLVIISADRPKHLIDIGDGQTIKQENVFDNHILYNANLIIQEAEEDQISNEKFLTLALKIAIQKKGPVHINVPFDEPLYETVELIEFNENKDKTEPNEPESVDDLMDKTELQKYSTIWRDSSKKMVLVGANFPHEELQKQLDLLVSDESVIVLTETTSNVYHTKFINGIDKVIFSLDDDELEVLKPEILLTMGGMIVSKKVKQFLRKHQPDQHWHVDSIRAFDTYHCLTHHIKWLPQLLLKQFLLTDVIKTSLPTYEGHYFQQKWLKLKLKRNVNHNKYLNEIKFSDLQVFKRIFDTIPHQTHLQLANSSVIRYSQLFDLNPNLRVFCNRGTSGIEGSTSTAIGAALYQDKPTVLITGDMSFLYDSNALWNSYIKNDFRIIMINNSGGGIFRFIPGPQSTNALEYFETPHHFNASSLCEMYGFEYESAEDEMEIKNRLKSFYNRSEQPKLLEIFTPQKVNDIVLKDYFKFLK